MTRKTKKQKELEELLCGIIVLLGIIGAVIYAIVIGWYITLPIIAIIIGIIASIYKIKGRNIKKTYFYFLNKIKLDIEKQCLNADSKLEKARSLQNGDFKEAVTLV